MSNSQNGFQLLYGRELKIVPDRHSYAGIPFHDDRR